MIFLPKYHSASFKLINSKQETDGRIINYYSNKTEVILNTGARREQYNDGYFVIWFENSDIRQHYPDGRILYYFA